MENCQRPAVIFNPDHAQVAAILETARHYNIILVIAISLSVDSSLKGSTPSFYPEVGFYRCGSLVRPVIWS